MAAGPGGVLHTLQIGREEMSVAVRVGEGMHGAAGETLRHAAWTRVDGGSERDAVSAAARTREAFRTPH